MHKVLTIVVFMFLILYSNSQALAQEDFPKTDSPSVILIDSKTGQIIYEKNSKDRLFPASITKVMTALLVLENCRLDEEVEASKRAVFEIEYGSNNIGIQPGETLTVEHLLYALMLSSANEAANVLAEHVGGSIEGFAVMMNARAKELGTLNTNFVTPNGLHKDNHYTTAFDMSLIARQAMTIPKFREIVFTTLYKIPNTNKYTKDDRYCLNSNRLIRETHLPGTKGYYYPYAIGIKTGYTTKANHTLIAGALKDGMELIAVCMNAQNQNGTMQTYSDSTRLFEYVFNNYHIECPVKAGQEIEETPVANSPKNTTLKILAQDDVQFILSNNPSETYTVNKIINSPLEAPINQDKVVGHMEFLVNGVLVGKTNLIAASGIEARPLTSTTIKEVAWSTLIVLRNIALVLLVLFLILVLYAKTKRRRKKRKSNLTKIERLLKED